MVHKIQNLRGVTTTTFELPKEISVKISYIKGLLTDDQLRTWRQIETIIERNTTDNDNDRSTVMKIYADDLRKELMR